MGWDQIATVAQLVTGIATLAVAVLLVSQLKVQHRDSERDFAFANETKQQDLIASWYSDESASNLLWKAYNSYEALAPEEVHRFRLMYQQMYLHQLNAWRLKRDGDDLRRWRLQWERILGSAGQRRYLEDWGRPILELDQSLWEFVEEIYQELESQAA
ncbi:MAG: hypothetical protein CL444_07920 [Acidimicrobiaceae bacterium]|nr:hypothetical protein [Acidimicrobiaceae bacterium]|tara:strand:+ start:152 stop:625 length:474 start_codon:yes stop_codon:yes gene_type:complete